LPHFPPPPEQLLLKLQFPVAPENSAAERPFAPKNKESSGAAPIAMIRPNFFKKFRRE